MITDTELRRKACKSLLNIWVILRERFIALIQREPFDYTQWRQTIDNDESIEELSRKAMELRQAGLEKQS